MTYRPRQTQDTASGGDGFMGMLAQGAHGAGLSSAFLRWLSVVHSKEHGVF